MNPVGQGQNRVKVKGSVALPERVKIRVTDLSGRVTSASLHFRHGFVPDVHDL